MKARKKNRLAKKRAADSAAYKAREAAIAAAGGIIAFNAIRKREAKKTADQAEAKKAGLSLRQWRKLKR